MTPSGSSNLPNRAPKCRRAHYIGLVLCLAAEVAVAQPFAHWNDRQLVLDNGAVRRVIALTTDGIGTVQLSVPGFDKNFIAGDQPAGEFSFTANGRGLSGADGWKFLRCEPAMDAQGGQGASVSLLSAGGLSIKVTYLLYPQLPVIRKCIAFENTGTVDLALENLDVERLQIAAGDVHCQIFTDYARRMKIGPYVGDWNDSLVILRFLLSDQKDRIRPTPWGIAFGNEAPGVTKRFTAFTGSASEVTVGLTHATQDYPFRKWIAPGGKWTSPFTFIVPYAREADPMSVLNGPVSHFVRKHMGVRLAKLGKKPTFVYNTWTPFRTNIDEKLIKELSTIAADLGIEEFVIDDGWQANRTATRDLHPIGDWLVHPEKFPHGLKPLFDHIKSLGLKPGLWLSLGAASVDSEVFRRHPEWFVRDAKGRPTNLHNGAPDRVTACLATGWSDHFKKIILDFVRTNGLEYVKLDLSIVTSAYMRDASMAGCSATDHPGHRDRAESFYAEYEALWRLFDELHAEAPDLFIDCTFEAMGKLQLIDYAMCQHAEGNWLSNFEEWSPQGGWRVRQMAWWRTPAMPATALVIGNQRLDDPEWELSLKSLTGALPVFLGDLRQVPPSQRQRIRQWSAWLRAMSRKYDFAMFRQDLPGFGEPAEGAWDGFARINTDTMAGGFVAVFRQHSLEPSRRLFIPGLPPAQTFAIKRAPDGAVMDTLTGQQLATTGLEVALRNFADGIVFEIERQ